MNDQRPEDITLEEQAKAYLAWRRLETVEYWDGVSWRKMAKHNGGSPLSISTTLRLKPTPKPPQWRALTPDETPLNGLFRHKGSKNTYKPAGLIYGVVKWCLFEDEKLTAEQLLKDYEYSVDGGIVWKPCGVLE